MKCCCSFLEHFTVHLNVCNRPSCELEEEAALSTAKDNYDDDDDDDEDGKDYEEIERGNLFFFS